MDPYEREMENRCDCNGFTGDNDLMDEIGQDEAQQVADDAAWRTARASWANTKILMKAMKVDL